MAEQRDEKAARDRPPWRSHPVLRFLPIALLAAAMVAVFATGMHESLTLEALVEQREAIRGFVAAHPARAIAFYVAGYVLGVSLSVPGAWLFTITGGFLFGWLLGGALAVLSATSGAVVIFLAARTSFGELLARKAGPKLQRVACGFRRDAFSYLLVLRLVPVVPFWFTNLAPALVGVPLTTFATATLIGIMPATFAFAVAGDGLDGIIAAQQDALGACRAAGRADCRISIGLSDLLTPELVVAIAALAVAALLPMLLRRLLGRRFGALDGEGGTS